MNDLTEFNRQALIQTAQEAAKRVRTMHPDLKLPEDRFDRIQWANEAWETWRDAFLDELARPAVEKQPEAPKRDYRILNCKGGRIAVIAPYNVTANNEYRRLMGVWGRVNDDRAWLFDASHRAHLEQYLDAMFPLKSDLQEVVITFQMAKAIDGEQFTDTDEAPAIDGVELLSFGRDYVGRINHAAVIEVVENTLDHGGSARYPRLSGMLKVRARIRSGASLTFGNHGEALVEHVEK